MSTTLKNTQTTPLGISSIAISGGSAAADYVLGGNCPASPSTLGPGQTCNITVTFTPSAPGMRTATLTVTDNARTDPLTISLSGMGVAPVGLTPSTLSLGAVAVHNPSATPSVALTDQKNLAHGRPLNPGGNAGLPVVGPVGTVPSPISVSMPGTGSSLVSVSPASLTFASGPLGTTSGAQTVTLTNRQNTSLTVSAAVATGDFAVASNTCGSSVAPGRSCTVGVTFRPMVMGRRTGTLTLPYSAAGSPSVIALSGSGNAEGLLSIAVTPANPSIVAGQTQQFTATGIFSDGITQNLTTSVLWSSSKPGVATINAAGLATSVSAGSTTITAAYATSNSASLATGVKPSTPIIVNLPISISTSLSGSTTLTVTSAFVSTGSLNTGRAQHTATLLNNGTVLIAGGIGDGNVPAMAELYDPTTGTFSNTGSLETPRYNHTATLLPSGMVLIVGGCCSSGPSGLTYFSSAELYNPATGAFTYTGNLNIARAEHTATLLANGMVLIAGGVGNNNEPANAELYDPTTGTFTLTGSLVTPRDSHTATLLDNGTVLIAAGEDVNFNVLMSAEVYDPTAGTFTATGNLNVPRQLHTATLLNNGMVLIAGGDNNLPGNTAELYDPSAGTFTPTGSMRTPRQYHTATLLNNGLVLMAGGADDSNYDLTASAELYNPATGTFAVTGSLHTARDADTATLLNDGAVLVVGGQTSTGRSTSAELFFPATLTPPNLVSISLAPTNPTIPLGTALRFTAVGTFSGGNTEPLAEVTWSSSNPGVISISNDASNAGAAWAAAAGSATISACAGAVCGSTTAKVGPPGPTSITGTASFASTAGVMTNPRIHYTATLLNNGLVLLAGGQYENDGDLTATAELYNPSTGVFTPTGSLNVIREYHTATLLNNGMVLLVGGYNGDTYLSSAELYNPATGTFTFASSLNVARQQHTATLLGNGQVLIAGGYGNTGALNIAELYDPASGTFLYTVGEPTVPGMTTTRYLHTATLLPNGQVLIAGGNNNSSILSTTELYDPATGVFTFGGYLNTGRQNHTATLLDNGWVLMAGGDTAGTPAITASAELYNPATGIFSSTGNLNTARELHTATLLTNGQVLIAGGDAGSYEDVPIYLSSAELFNPVTGTFVPTGSLNLAREYDLATLLPNGTVLFTGGMGTGGVISIAELYDPATLTPPNLVSISLTPSSPTIPLGTGQQFTAYGTFSGGDTEQLDAVTWTSSNPGVISISDDASDAGEAWAAASGSATLTACAGFVCGSTTATVGAPGPNSITGSAGFVATAGSMNLPREGQTATLLNNGQVLVVGGDYGEDGNTAELYDPNARTFTYTGSMSTPRNYHTATLLNNGLVLVTGGNTCCTTYTASTAELYNPATGTFTPTGSMNIGRALHTATLLPNGMVLITGGQSYANNENSQVASAELYDPLSGTFTYTGSLNDARYAHTATLLPNGQVLIAGGDGNNGYLLTAELYNPATGTFSYTAGGPGQGMAFARVGHTATLLNNGQVLMVGGYGYVEQNDGEVAQAELYDPGTQTFILSGSLNAPRDTHTATLLTNGLVLIAGGEGYSITAGQYEDYLTTSELYDPATGTFGITGSLNTGRDNQTATLLNNGTVLIAGGYIGNSPYEASSAELYAPATLTPAGLLSISIAPANPTISLGTAQRFIATGTFSGGSTEELAEVTWSSSNPGVISVSDDASNAGAAWAATTGSATITACAGEVCGSTTATVGPAGPDSLTGSGSFGAAGNMLNQRQYHTATLLPNGQVLMAGGADADFDCLYSAELYNPTTGAFTATGNLHTGRYSHTATLLNNGLVLITGGYYVEGTTNTAELYNPATGTFTPTGNMHRARVGHTATLLNNGQVLIAGGYLDDSSAELYDPTTGTFALTGRLNVARENHTATLLHDGTVLIAAGFDGDVALKSAEIYNPADGTFTELSQTLNLGRFYHTATLLNNGQVLLAGGELSSNPYETATAELYNPDTQTFTYTTGSMDAPRFYHTATLLTNGLVLVTGGCPQEDGQYCDNYPLYTADLYDPASGTFALTSYLNVQRTFHTATLLNNGQVLLVGGAYDGEDDVTTTTELYGPATLTPPGLVSISLSPANPTIPLGSAQRFLATGTFSGGDTEQLAEVIWSSSNPGVISISDDASNAGAAYAATTGSATVTACAGVVCGSMMAKVGAPLPVSIAVTPASQMLPAGLSVQFHANATYADGTTQDVTSSVTWTSSLPAIASINTGGDATGLTQGVSTIAAALGSVQGMAALTVTPPVLVSIAVAPANAAIAAGKTQQYAATGTYSDGSTGDLTSTANWSSSATSVATIVPGGLATAVGVGQAMITAASGAINGSTPLTVTAGFDSTGSLLIGRYYHTATLLNNGLVLVAGGLNHSGFLGSAELYDPTAGTFSSTGSLSTPRYLHTATLLSNGMVLIAGGACSGSAPACVGGSSDSAELYDPATGAFSPLANLMATPRYSHTATLLPSGQVLIAGGANSGGSLSSAELYNPAAGTFTATGSLANSRELHTATLLNNGSVLIAGGSSNGSPSGALNSAELYNPATANFTATGNLTTYRYAHTATLLDSGLVLLAGGAGTSGRLSSAELYDPDTDTFSATGNLTTQRIYHTATLLNNGMVLVAAGIDSTGNPSNSAELYDSDTATFAATINLPGAREHFTATRLNNGMVLIVGGTSNGSSSGALNSADLYEPATLTLPDLVSIAVSPSSFRVPLGSALRFSATGTFSGGSTEELRSVIWNSSNSQVVSVSNDASNRGAAYAAAPGAATITACAGAVCGSAAVTVGAPLVSIAITPANAAAGIGGSVQFSATGTLGDGSTQDISSAVSWTSSVASVATLNGSGLASGLNAGLTTITAAWGGVQGSTALTVTGGFALSGSLGTATAGQTTTLLNNGLVLLAGGTDSNGEMLPIATLYDPTAGTFTPTGSLRNGRYGHTATLLNNGLVLIAGGATSIDPLNGAPVPGASAELYNPATGTFTSTGNLNTARSLHTATLLGNGMVLIAGGCALYSPINFCAHGTDAAELYDPTAGVFLPTGSLNYARVYHTATLLSDGLVLIAGGSLNGFWTNVIANAEVYNPATGTFFKGPFLNTPRINHTATLLNNGMVLIAGGNGQVSGVIYGPFASAELYNPATGSFGTFSSTGSLEDARSGQTATLLNNGQVLIASGCTSPTQDFGCAGVTNAAELYDPDSGLFSLTGSLTTARAADTATLLNNGAVLLAGGIYDGNGDVTSGAELYEPATLTPPNLASIAVSPGSFTVLLGGALHFSATGTLRGGNTEELASVTWTSSNPQVLSVSNDASNPGEADAAAPGTATITACAGAVCGSAAVTVSPALVSLAVTPAYATVGIGNALQFSATGTLSDGSTLDITSQVSWTSSLPSVATIYGGGLASGLSAGITTITASLGAVQGSVALVVGPALGYITLSPSTGEVPPFQSVQFSAFGTFADGSERYLTSWVNWSSSAPGVATITSGGLASSISIGSTTITATFGSMQGSAPLTVTAGGLAVTTGAMKSSRLRATATLLNDGLVLMTGGYDSSGSLSSVEYYDSSSGTFTPLPSLHTPRYAHTATLLNNGYVLVAGGLNSGYALASAEVRSGGGFAPTSTNLNIGRYGHTATLLPSGIVLLAGGIDPNGFPTTSAELYNPTTQVFSLTGSLRTARAWHTATLLNNGLVLIAGGENLSGVVDSAELYDPNTNSFQPTGGLESARYLHTATLLGNGQVLLAGGLGGSGYLATAELYDPGTGSFTPAGSLNTARDQHAAVLLNNGMVLIAGGENSSGFLASEELYNPGSETFALTGSLSAARGAPTATLLADGSGRVLIAGGYNSSGYSHLAELYEPNTFTPPELESISITPQSVTLSPNSTQKFTAVGTFRDGTTQQLGAVTWSSSNGSLAQISNDVTNPGEGMALANANASVTITARFVGVSGSATLTLRPFSIVASTGSLNLARYQHTATLLNNGQVLIAGGCSGEDLSGNCTNWAGPGELYDPTADAFTNTGSMNFPRSGHTATLLNNGMVLIAGGIGPNGDVANAELYNPATGTFSLTGSLQTPRQNFTATLLNTGQVLIVGGQGSNGNSLASAELYDPSTQTFTATGSLLEGGRHLHTATLLHNGQVLIAGGFNTPYNTYAGIAELYDPASGTFTTTGTLTFPRIYHTATLLVDGTVLVAGGESSSGFPSMGELYTPATGIFTLTVGGLIDEYWGHTATLLNYDGYVLIAGGHTDTTEWYVPSSASFDWLGINLDPAPTNFTATLLNSGMVLFTGGRDVYDNILNNANLY